jgi:hypothetical protein
VSVSSRSTKPNTTPATSAIENTTMKRPNTPASAAPASAANDPKTISTIIGPVPEGHAARYPPQLPPSIACASP